VWTLPWTTSWSSSSALRQGARPQEGRDPLPSSASSAPRCVRQCVYVIVCVRGRGCLVAPCACESACESVCVRRGRGCWVVHVHVHVPVQGMKVMREEGGCGRLQTGVLACEVPVSVPVRPRPTLPDSAGHPRARCWQSPRRRQVVCARTCQWLAPR
jgi:hypothetical protein